MITGTSHFWAHHSDDEVRRQKGGFRVVSQMAEERFENSRGREEWSPIQLLTWTFPCAFERNNFIVLRFTTELNESSFNYLLWVPIHPDKT
jgi:hypothetical protein